MIHSFSHLYLLFCVLCFLCFVLCFFTYIFSHFCLILYDWLYVFWSKKLFICLFGFINFCCIKDKNELYLPFCLCTYTHIMPDSLFFSVLLKHFKNQSAQHTNEHQPKDPEGFDYSSIARSWWTTKQNTEQNELE